MGYHIMLLAKHRKFKLKLSDFVFYINILGSSTILKVQIIFVSQHSFAYFLWCISHLIKIKEWHYKYIEICFITKQTSFLKFCNWSLTSIKRNMPAELGQYSKLNAINVSVLSSFILFVCYIESKMCRNLKTDGDNDQRCTPLYPTVQGTDKHWIQLYSTVQGTDKHCTPLTPLYSPTDQHCTLLYMALTSTVPNCIALYRVLTSIVPQLRHCTINLKKTIIFLNLVYTVLFSSISFSYCTKH